MNIFIKSMEKDFTLKQLQKDKKVPFQTVEDINKTKTIKPNTKSFGEKDRLACSYLSEKYQKSYRSQGIIFSTEQNPDSVLPFDMILVTETEKPVVQYYRIANKLQEHYSYSLLEGYEKFIFKTPQALEKEFRSLAEVWFKVNEFRMQHGLKELPKSKYKLIEYNECIFFKAVKIELVGIFGYSKESKKIAKKLQLPHFRNVKEFYKKQKDFI